MSNETETKKDDAKGKDKKPKPGRKPKVGESVHYFANPSADARAAIVTHVHDAKTVNLAIFKESGRPMGGPPTSIPLLGAGDKAEGYHCNWPEN